jgi:tetratricopeptide (TPR) repeat protein
VERSSRTGGSPLRSPSPTHLRPCTVDGQLTLDMPSSQAEFAYRQAVAEGSRTHTPRSGSSLVERGRFDEAVRHRPEQQEPSEYPTHGVRIARRRCSEVMAPDQLPTSSTAEGWRHQQAGDLAAAERLYREALAEGEPDAGYYLGELLIELDRSAEAVPVLRAAYDAGDTDALIPLGNALWDQGDVEGAEARYREAADRGELAAGHNLGLLLYDLHRYDEAIALWRTTVVVGETEHRLLANALADTGEVEEAEKWFREGAAAGDIEALVDLGALLQDEDRLDEAEAILREALTAGATEAYVFLASVLRLEDRVDEAEVVLREGVQRGIGSAETQLGNHLSDANPKSAEAEQLYRSAVQHGDDDAYNNLGVLLWDQGRVAEAEAAFREGADRGDELAAGNLAGLLDERKG